MSKKQNNAEKIIAGADGSRRREMSGAKRREP
jgi:hypothetical protein